MPKVVQQIHRCKVCGVDCQGDVPYEQHLRGKKHLRKAAQVAEAGAAGASEQQRDPKRPRAAPSESAAPESGILGSMTLSAQQHSIQSSNRGHQMLLKMGWAGGGLGATGCGRQVPVMVSTVHRGRVGLGGALAFPGIVPENQAFLRQCEVCGEPVPKQLWDEHCAGRKHQRKLKLAQPGAQPNTKRRINAVVTATGEADGRKEVLVQAAQRFCEACQRAVPVKAWSMHCAGKKHKAKLARLQQLQNQAPD